MGLILDWKLGLFYSGDNFKLYLDPIHNNVTGTADTVISVSTVFRLFSSKIQSVSHADILHLLISIFLRNSLYFDVALRNRIEIAISK